MNLRDEIMEQARALSRQTEARDGRWFKAAITLRAHEYDQIAASELNPELKVLGIQIRRDPPYPRKRI